MVVGAAVFFFTLLAHDHDLVKSVSLIVSFRVGLGFAAPPLLHLERLKFANAKANNKMDACRKLVTGIRNSRFQIVYEVLQDFEGSRCRKGGIEIMTSTERSRLGTKISN